MQKIFSFRGINRSADVSTAADGECLDVVNLRMSNGSLLPMPQPVKVAESDNLYSSIFWHEMAECYIAITDDDANCLHFYDKNFVRIMSGDTAFAIDNLYNVNGVEFLGNIVCCFTVNGIFYLLYENGLYRALGERPAIPDVNITVSSKVESLVTDDAYYKMGTVDDLELTWNYNERGYIDQCISLLNKAGYYIDRALFRVALRLYDGSYINISNVIYVCDEKSGDGVGRDSKNMLTESQTTSNPSKYIVDVRGFKPTFSFDASVLDSWRNVVVGVDVFSTASIPGKRIELGGRAQKFEMYTDKSLDGLWDDIASASLYYKVAEYDIDGNLLFRLDDVSAVSLALQQGLDTQSIPSSLSSYGVKNSYVYNGRLHIAAFKEYFFKGYDAAAFLPVNGGSRKAGGMLVQVKVRTTQGDFVTERYYPQPILGDDGYTLQLPPMLTYPDARACEMSVYIRDGKDVYGKVFPLKAHKYLNIAYYLHKWYSPYSTSVTALFAGGGAPAASVSTKDVLDMFDSEPGVYDVVYSSSNNCWMFKGEPFPPDEFKHLRVFAIHRNAVDGDKLVFTIKRDGLGDMSFLDINNIPVDGSWDIYDSMPDVDFYPYEERANVMKVSMVENPFVFQAKCTYTPSQSAVVGLASNTVALSEGQFGQFPLYLFCADGVWAMSVDSSGGVAYLSCNQVSRDVCVNADTICCVGAGVVFAGKRGLMLINGNSVDNLSAEMEGHTLSPVGVPGDIFNRISSMVSLESGGDYDFQSFIGDGFVSYLPAHNEILVGNTGCKYSFVYSFVSGVWSRFSSAFAGEVKGGRKPLFFTLSASGTKIHSIPDEQTGDNRVLLFSRPQMWGTKLPKRIMQLLLYAHVALPELPTSGVPLLGCYMLGSNDGVHFKIIAGNEKVTRTQDVLFPYFPTQSYKYYMFAIIGDMGKGSVITGMEIDVNVPWRNRLR